MATRNPILDVGPARAWDSVVAKLPAGVIKRQGLYHLFYSGLDTSTKQIGLATSRQLTGPWTKAPGNPVLKSRPGQWDAFLSTYPAPVFEQQGNYYLLFRGMQTRYRRQGSGLAASTDLRNWRRCNDSPVIPMTEEMASLAVARSGGRYVGISQPIDLTQRRYWFSADLKHWQKGPPVNFRASGEGETLSNPFLSNGHWSVLYEQKDRIYRAVLKSAIVADGDEDYRLRATLGKDLLALGRWRAWCRCFRRAVPFCLLRVVGSVVVALCLGLRFTPAAEDSEAHNR